MRIDVAHVKIQGVNCLICASNAVDGTDAGRQAVLSRLVAQARLNNLRVDKAALAYRQHGQLRFYGTPDLVKFLSTNGLPDWTHTLSI